MVEVAVGRVGELDGAEAGVMEGFVVKANAPIGVVSEMVGGESA